MSHHPLLIVKARHIIRHSYLNDTDKQLMFERLPYLDSGMLALFIQSAEENPFAVDAIAKSMKAKLDTRGNLHQLHKVLEKEAAEIKGLEEDDMDEVEVEDKNLTHSN